MSRSRVRLLAALVVLVGLALAIRADAGAPPGQYDVQADTVYDTKTGLTWQRNIPATPCAGSATCTQAQALAYCQGLSLGGFSSGWRLPNVKELQTIVDDSTYGPAIDTTAFPGTPSEYFWSSSPYANNTSHAWVVYFLYGYVYFPDVGFYHRVRCVR